MRHGAEMGKELVKVEHVGFSGAIYTAVEHQRFDPSVKSTGFYEEGKGEEVEESGSKKGIAASFLPVAKHEERKEKKRNKIEFH